MRVPFTNPMPLDGSLSFGNPGRGISKAKPFPGAFPGAPGILGIVGTGKF